jgi:hypothetical protein
MHRFRRVRSLVADEELLSISQHPASTPHQDLAAAAFEQPTRTKLSQNVDGEGRIADNHSERLPERFHNQHVVW